MTAEGPSFQTHYPYILPHSVEKLTVNFPLRKKHVRKSLIISNFININIWCSIDVVQFQEKFAYRITRFATKHSFATQIVQLRYKGLLLLSLFMIITKWEIAKNNHVVDTVYSSHLRLSCTRCSSDGPKQG